MFQPNWPSDRGEEPAVAGRPETAESALEAESG